jgi:hypothetical protein
MTSIRKLFIEQPRKMSKKRLSPIQQAEREFQKTGHYTTDTDNKPIFKGVFGYRRSIKIVHNHSPYAPHGVTNQ